MKSSTYWNKRFVQLQVAQLNKGVEAYAHIAEQYEKAAYNITKEIESFFFDMPLKIR